jgi:hypothetical protein
MICECCGEAEGKLSQAPWPFPLSTCHCNDCYALEGVAFGVWRELNPDMPKFNAPTPFLKGKIDYPPESLKGNILGLREWFKNKFTKKDSL